MECLHCKGKMIKKTAPLHLDRKGYYLHFNSIPAWVCTQCGEPLFEEMELDKIQAILTYLDDKSSALVMADDVLEAA